jgi:hypothetical protein
MSSIGINFCSRFYVFPKFDRLAIEIFFYALNLLRSVSINCNFNKLPTVRKFTIIIRAFIFVASPKMIIFPIKVNHYVRKPVREFGLSNETPKNC